MGAPVFVDFRTFGLGLPGAHRVQRRLYRAGLFKNPQAEPCYCQPYFSSHHELLRPLDRGMQQDTDEDKPGAIVVPTGRPGTAVRSGIQFAARLALTLGRPLVILVSQAAGERDGMLELERQITVATKKGPVQPDTLVLRTLGRPTRLTTFGVDQLPLSRSYREGADVFGQGRLTVNDVGRKRNLALLLAAGMNWRSVLMLDDDVFTTVDGEGGVRRAHSATLDPASLSAGVRALADGHLAAGWAARGFDDNSVLCRIAGVTGAPQDQFIGAGALLVPIRAETPFFPSIYNSDWLFLLGLLRHRVAGTAELLCGGDVHQDEYPAYLASRAAAEELGDTLGEGLLSLAHAGRPGEPPSPAFWRHALATRREFRQMLEDEVSGCRNDLREDMLRALATVKNVQQRIAQEEPYWVAQFVAYTKRWVKDLDAWGRRLHPDDLPKPDRLVRSREFDAARCYGRFGDPHQFLRELAGEGIAEATSSPLVGV
jgi:hypothetical protein